MNSKNRKSKDTVKNSNWVNRNILSLIALLIASSSAFFAYQQSEISKQSMKISNRPYIIVQGTETRVWITYPPMFSDSVDNVQTDVIFKNVGQTPSFKTKITAAINLYPKNFTNTPDYGDTPKESVELSISKDLTYKYTAESFRPFYEEEIRKVLAGELFFYLYGQVDYRDIFGDKHRTKFCFILNNPHIVGFNHYEKHNEAD